MSEGNGSGRLWRRLLRGCVCDMLHVYTRFWPSGCWVAVWDAKPATFGHPGSCVLFLICFGVEMAQNSKAVFLARSLTLIAFAKGRLFT